MLRYVEYFSTTGVELIPTLVPQSPPSMSPKERNQTKRLLVANRSIPFAILIDLEPRKAKRCSKWAPCFLFPEWCFSFPWGHFSRIGFFVPVMFFCSGRCFWCPGICFFFCPWNRFECYRNRFFGSPWYFRPEGIFLCPTEMKCPRVFLVPVLFGNIDFAARFNEKRFTKQRYGRC